MITKQSRLTLWGKHPSHGNYWLKIQIGNYRVINREATYRATDSNWSLAVTRFGDKP
jgi:hypothetical protein